MRSVLVAAMTLLLMVLAVPASASTDLRVSFHHDDSPTSAVPASPVVPDSPIVVAGEPTRACAAPAFAQPIDHVAAPPLAATGMGPALQVIALTAVSIAGLMAPRRRAVSESTWVSPRGHGDPQD